MAEMKNNLMRVTGRLMMQAFIRLDDVLVNRTV